MKRGREGQDRARDVGNSQENPKIHASLRHIFAQSRKRREKLIMIIKKEFQNME